MKEANDGCPWSSAWAWLIILQMGWVIIGSSIIQNQSCTMQGHLISKFTMLYFYTLHITRQIAILY